MRNATKQEIIADIDRRVADKILEPSNASLLKKLINKAETINEALSIAELGTTYKRTGFHFDKRLEKETDTITYFQKNKDLSFETNKNSLTHKLIIGDNYPALLNLLVEYRNRIDVIYIDPPYGKDSMGEFAQTNYENAITRDNLLSMLYPRLLLARQLLSDNGVIFCSIDDKNQAYVKCLFDEIFGEANFVSMLTWQDKYTTTNDNKGISSQTDYILCYSKSIENLLINKLPLREEYIEKTYKNPDNDPNGPYMTVQMYKKKNPYSFKVTSPSGKIWDMPWNFTKESFAQLQKENKIFWGSDGNSCPRKKVYLKDSLGINPVNLLLGKDVGYSSDGGEEIERIFDDRNVFLYPKPVNLMKHLFKISSNKNSIILDFFAGSGTTGQAVLELNKEDEGKRQFILCTNNEITDTTPNGIAYDVTSKRLKRVMTGKCYDGTNNFKWLEKNKPLGDNLLVLNIQKVANFANKKGETPFDLIDETLYDKPKFKTLREKTEWVCDNFEITQKEVK